MKILIVGISGTSRDLLLSIYTLKSYLLADLEIFKSSQVNTLQYPYLIPSSVLPMISVAEGRGFNKGCENIISSIINFEPDLLAFSIYTWSADAIFFIIEQLRIKNIDIPIVIGGPEISAGDIRNGKYDAMGIDYIIYGEGEEPLRRLVRGLLDSDNEYLSDTPRLAIKTGRTFSGRQLDDSRACTLAELDGSPSPFLTNTIPAELLSDPLVQANIETQRGCNFRCAYCLYHAQFPTIRYHSVQRVLEEVRYLAARGVKSIRITDANFPSDRSRAKEIMRGLVTDNTAMRLFFEAIPSFIDEEFASLLGDYMALHASNQVLIGIGLQSIFKPALKAINRVIPISAFNTAFDLLQQTGVIVKTDVILGLPKETKQSWYDLLEYISEKMRFGRNHLTIAVLRVLPGSSLEPIAQTENLTVDNSNFEHFVYETPTMPRADYVDCLRLSAVAYRLFYTEDQESMTAVRDAYFSLKDAHNETHVEFFKHFTIEIFEHLSGSNSDFVTPDFMNAEHYWSFNVFKEISDEFLFELFNKYDKLLGSTESLQMKIK